MRISTRIFKYGSMNTKNQLTIAIDGYSSSGKSTLARQLADCLSLLYVDSGAMYRAVTYYFLENDVDLHNSVEVEKALENIHIEFKRETEELRTYLNGTDVTTEIRTLKVSSFVSEVSTIASVREVLVEQQRAMQEKNGIVMDGRDIGTVVFPNADVKFFVTADIDVRVERRYAELIKKGFSTDRATVKRNLEERDYLDSHREISPLKMAEDSVVIDNTSLNKEEQLNKSIEVIKSRFPDISTENC